MLKIYITNLAMLIVTMVKLIIMGRLIRVKPTIIKLTMVILVMVSFNFNYFVIGS